MKMRIYSKMLILFLGLFSLGACTKGNSQDTESMKIVEQAEVMPEFPGGMDGLITYMVQNVEYPKSEKETGNQGKVYVQFIVSKNGDVLDAKVKKGVSEALDKVALIAVQNMPNWTPGSQDGKKVNVQMILPISFAL